MPRLYRPSELLELLEKGVELYDPRDELLVVPTESWVGEVDAFVLHASKAETQEPVLEVLGRSDDVRVMSGIALEELVKGHASLRAEALSPVEVEPYHLNDDGRGWTNLGDANFVDYGGELCHVSADSVTVDVLHVRTGSGAGTLVGRASELVDDPFPTARSCWLCTVDTDDIGAGGLLEGQAKSFVSWIGIPVNTKGRNLAEVLREQLGTDRLASEMVTYFGPEEFGGEPVLGDETFAMTRDELDRTIVALGAPQFADVRGELHRWDDLEQRWHAAHERNARNDARPRR